MTYLLSEKQNKVLAGSFKMGTFKSNILSKKSTETHVCLALNWTALNYLACDGRTGQDRKFIALLTNMKVYYVADVVFRQLISSQLASDATRCGGGWIMQWQNQRRTNSLVIQEDARFFLVRSCRLLRIIILLIP